MNSFSRLTKSIFLGIAATGLVLSTAQALTQPYPDMPVTEPTTDYPETFVPFNVSSIVSDYTVDDRAPQIAEWTRRNNPGDTMALTAEAIDGDAVGFVLYGGGITDNGLIQRIDGRLAAVTLPSTLPVDEMYLMWPRNANGVGEPVAINAAELWWANSYVATGGKFRVFGQNFKLDGTNHLYIAELNQWLSTTICNPYMAEYTLPASAVAGTYTIYAHNGHGGKYGWSDPLSIEVWNGFQFSEVPSTWYDVTDNPYANLSGDGITDNTSALASLWSSVRNDAWPTIYFPAGNYLISGSTEVSIAGGSCNGARFIGDGTNSVISCKTTTGGDGSIELYRDNLVFKNLSFAKLDNGVINGSSASIKHKLGGIDNILFENVLFDDRLHDSKAEDGRISYWNEGGGTENRGLTFLNCDIISNRHWELRGRYITFDGCRFWGMDDVGGYASMNVSEFALIDSTNYTHWDASDSSYGDGWGKGRWYTSGLNKAAANWYVGGNSSTNAQPRLPTPRMTAYPISIDPPVSFSADHYTQRVYFTSLADCGRDDIIYLTVPYGAGLIYHYPVINFSRANNYCDVKYEKWWYDRNKDWKLTSASTSLLMGLQDYNDHNAGEQFMKEGGISKYRGIVTSATNNTVTFADLSSKYTYPHLGLVATIVSGKGVGQSRLVTGIEGQTATLDRNWTVEPDTTSALAFGQFAARWAIYDNDLHSDLSQYTRTICASAGVQFSSGGGGHSVVVDKNTFTGQRYGLSLDMSDFELVNGALTAQVVSPWYFGRVENNLYEGCKYDFLDGTISYPVANANPYYPEDTLMLGLVYRGNASTDAEVYVYYTKQLNAAYSKSKNRMNMNIFDNNTASNFATLCLATKERDNDILVGNTFYGSGSSTGWELVNDNVALHGNTFVGFTSKYRGNLPGAILELPVRLGYTNAVEQTFDVYNSGTASMTATANGQTKIIAAESSASFTYTATNATSYVVSAGEESMTFYVFASENPLGGVSVSKGGKVWDLKPWWGQPLRAELKDMTLDSVLKSWEPFELENAEDLVVLDNELTLDHQYRLRIEQYDGTKWVRVVGDTWKEKGDQY